MLEFMLLEVWIHFTEQYIQQIFIKHITDTVVETGDIVVKWVNIPMTKSFIK